MQPSFPRFKVVPGNVLINDTCPHIISTNFNMAREYGHLVLSSLRWPYSEQILKKKILNKIKSLAENEQKPN